MKKRGGGPEGFRDVQNQKGAARVFGRGLGFHEKVVGREKEPMRREEGTWLGKEPRQ